MCNLYTDNCWFIAPCWLVLHTTISLWSCSKETFFAGYLRLLGSFALYFWCLIQQVYWLTLPLSKWSLLGLSGLHAARLAPWPETGKDGEESCRRTWQDGGRPDSERWVRWPSDFCEVNSFSFIVHLIDSYKLKKPMCACGLPQFYPSPFQKATISAELV